MVTKNYTVKTPITHNDKNYAVGASIELDDKTEAPQLLGVDAIEPATAAKKAEK